MQTLAEKGEVDSRVVNRRRFQIAQPVLQIRDAVLPRQPRPELHHLRRIIHGDHAFRPLGEQLRKRPFARAQIRDHHRRHQLQQSLGQTFPAAPRHVIAPELPGELVEIAAHLVAPLFQYQLKGPGVVSRFRNLGRGGMEEIDQVAGR